MTDERTESQLVCTCYTLTNIHDADLPTPSPEAYQPCMYHLLTSRFDPRPARILASAKEQREALIMVKVTIAKAIDRNRRKITSRPEKTPSTSPSPARKSTKRVQGADKPLRPPQPKPGVLAATGKKPAGKGSKFRAQIEADPDSPAMF